MNEVWRDVNGFPDYRISTYGRVWNDRRERYLTPFRHSKDYLKVRLYVDGMGHQLYVHLLVAETFLKDWRDGVRIGFADGDTDNCHIDNLFIRGEYQRYSRKINPNGTARRVRVVQTGEIFPSAQKCAEVMNADTVSIYKVCKGEQKTHLGYTFEFVSNHDALQWQRMKRL